MLRFREVPVESEPARPLVAAFREEIAAIYDGLAVDGPEMPKAGPRELAPPGGTFLVGFDEDDRPVACGGIKDLGDGACEIKRMYVAPRSRGGGRGRELLAALEDAARGLGHRIVRLDTGPRQPGAERMYREAGYAPIANFNANPMASFFGEKAL
jgi:GNAT superfamily N-acetyltransferase